MKYMLADVFCMLDLYIYLVFFRDRFSTRLILLSKWFFFKIYLVFFSFSFKNHIFLQITLNLFSYNFLCLWDLSQSLNYTKANAGRFELAFYILSNRWICLMLFICVISFRNFGLETHWVIWGLWYYLLEHSFCEYYWMLPFTHVQQVAIVFSLLFTNLNKLAFFPSFLKAIVMPMLSISFTRLMNDSIDLTLITEKAILLYNTLWVFALDMLWIYLQLTFDFEPSL